MRTLFIVIVVVAIGYLGWTFREELTGKIQEITNPNAKPAETAEATPPPVEPVADLPPTPATLPMPTELAPPGSFYVKERVTVVTDTGVKALRKGELVRLMYRNKDGTVRVTANAAKAEMTIKESFLTNDPTQIGR